MSTDISESSAQSSEEASIISKPADGFPVENISSDMSNPDADDPPMLDSTVSNNNSSASSNLEPDPKNLVTFKIVDSNGNPIPDVYLDIDRDTNPIGDSTFYSDNNGVITYDFSLPRLGLGKHTIDIVETFKINKEARHEINVKELPAEIELLWDYGNPAEIVWKPDTTATLYFRDEEKKPVGGYLVMALFNYSSEESDTTDIAERIGVISNDGVLIWNSPPIGNEVELRILDGTEFSYDIATIKHYKFVTASKKGNTDYTFLW